MDKKLLVIGLAALLIGVAGAIAVQNYFYPQKAKVGDGAAELAVYLDGTLWLNGTTIDWGTVEPNNMYSFNLTIQNKSNATVLVYIEFIDLPLDWFEIWTANGTVLDYEESAVGSLNLIVPSSASNGTYTWTSYIKGEYT